MTGIVEVSFAFPQIVGALPVQQREIRRCHPSIVVPNAGHVFIEGGEGGIKFETQHFHA